MGESRFKWSPMKRSSISCRTASPCTSYSMRAEWGASFTPILRCRMLGYSLDEIENVESSGHSGSVGIKDVPLAGGESAQREILCFEKILVRKNGTKVPAEINARLFSEGGRQMVLASIRDITGRRGTRRHFARARNGSGATSSSD